MHKKIYNTILDYIGRYIGDNQIASRIIKGSFWSVIGGIISKFIALIGGVYVARILGAEKLGGYGVIISTIGVFGMFASAGMGLTATKYIAKYNVLNDKRTVSEFQSLGLISSLITSILFSSLLYVFSSLISIKILNNIELVTPVKIVSVSIVFSSLNGVFLGIISGLEHFKSITKINVIHGFINYPLILLLTYFYGLIGTVLGFTIGMAALSVIYYFELHNINKEYGFSIDLDLSLIKKYKHILISYSLPAIFGGSLVGPIIWVSNIIFLKSEDAYSELGFYQAGNQLKLLVVFFPTLLSNILLPLLAGTDSKKSYKKVLKLNMAINLIIAIFFSIGLIVFSKKFMGLYGEGFESHYKVLIFLALTAVAMTYNSVIGKSIASSGNMWYGFMFNGLWGVVLLISTYITVKYSYGAEGLAFSYFLAYFFHSIWQTIYLKLKNII